MIFGPKINATQSSKGGFFSESSIHFLDLQISKKKIFQKTILNLKFKFPANNSIKLRIVFWNIFFLRFGDLKNRIAFSEKKPPLSFIQSVEGASVRKLSYVLGLNL